MRLMPIVIVAAVVGLAAQRGPGAPAAERGARLSNLTWVEAGPKLTPQSVVVIPVGPGSSEHGPHLQMRADLALAEYLAGRLIDAGPVVVAPALTVHYAPGLSEYPGSATVSINTARDMVADLVRSLARFGPKRFYVVAIGEGAPAALDPAATLLGSEGILLRYSKFAAMVDRASRGVRQQTVVGHADEIETSMLLYAAPDVVDMSKAVRDFSPAAGFGRLTRRRDGPGIFSETGVWGDATLATKDKGRAIVEAIMPGLVQDIEELRTAELPAARPVPAEAPAPVPGAPPARPSTAAGECTPGDERAIASIGDLFGTAWAALDAQRLGNLWSATGNIVHPDGLVERGGQAIAEARAELFSRREYRATRHPIKLAMVRCLAGDLAIADGTWELRGLTTTSGAPVPTLEGQCALVVRRDRARGWLIEAYRYSMKVPTVPVPPNVLKRPGYPGGQ